MGLLLKGARGLFEARSMSKAKTQKQKKAGEPEGTVWSLWKPRKVLKVAGMDSKAEEKDVSLQGHNWQGTGFFQTFNFRHLCPGDVGFSFVNICLGEVSYFVL